MEDKTILVVAPLWILLGVVIIYSLWRRMRPWLPTLELRKKSTFRQLVISYLLLGFAINAFAMGLYLIAEKLKFDGDIIGPITPIFSLLSAPFNFAEEVLVIIAGLWLAVKMLPRFGYDTSSPEVAFYSLKLNEQVRAIFRSEEFLTALSTSLPRGEKDAEYGLDYIPYMLQSIEARRRRFLKSSHVFLIATVVTGAVFAAVLMYLGYLLVNEAAAGTPRLLANVEGELRETRQTLALMRGGLFENERLEELAGNPLQRIEKSAPGDGNMKLASGIRSSIAAARTDGRLQLLIDALTKASRVVSRTDQTERAYAGAIIDARNGLLQYMAEASSAVPRLDESTRSLNSLLPQVRASLEQPVATTAEVVRRIAIGFLVSTFLLAILRYMAGIYSSHHQQMLRAEADDLAVRRFYVAYKSTAQSPEDLRGVVTTFLSGPANVESVSGPQALNLSKEEAGLIKDFLSALSKKL